MKLKRGWELHTIKLRSHSCSARQGPAFKSGLQLWHGPMLTAGLDLPLVASWLLSPGGSAPKTTSCRFALLSSRRDFAFKSSL